MTEDPDQDVAFRIMAGNPLNWPCGNLPSAIPEFISLWGTCPHGAQAHPPWPHVPSGKEDEGDGGKEIQERGVPTVAAAPQGT